MGTPAAAPAPRIFVSYSHQDDAAVQRLKRDLEVAGATIWIDHEQLTPGTHDWEKAVRAGIRETDFVVYAASLDAAESPFVRDEINLARGKGREVIPFWVAGDDWLDCAPLGWGMTQYVDGRGASYQAGLERLLRRLSLSASTAPLQTANAVTPQTAAAVRIAAQPFQMSATPAPSRPINPLADVPVRLVSLGFRSLYPNRTPAILPPLVTVTAGPFLMGSDKDRDLAAYDDETPQHRVELATFQIGKYPVTVAEYALAMRADAVREPPTLHRVTWQMQLQRLDHPVVSVSWRDAMAYTAWLREVTGQRGWRLPSEAEWEKAARWNADRGVSRIYPWGDTFEKDRCNTHESHLGTTTPVNSYPASDQQCSGASAYGTEDMAGNVWEWTSSRFMPYPYILTDGREDQYSTDNRTLHGGSWDGHAGYARAAFRANGRWDGLSDLNAGFRLAFSPLTGS